MTIQLNFDKNNQQRLLDLIKWLKDIGLIKSYKISGGAVDNELDDKQLELLLKKDSTGKLSKVSKDTLRSILSQAKDRLVPEQLADTDVLTVAFAALLYDNEILTAGQAAAFSGMEKANFIRQLGKYQVSSFGETLKEINAL